MGEAKATTNSHVKAFQSQEGRSVSHQKRHPAVPSNLPFWMMAMKPENREIKWSARTHAVLQDSTSFLSNIEHPLSMSVLKSRVRKHQRIWCGQKNSQVRCAFFASR